METKKFDLSNVAALIPATSAPRYEGVTTYLLVTFKQLPNSTIQYRILRIPVLETGCMDLRNPNIQMLWEGRRVKWGSTSAEMDKLEALRVARVRSEATKEQVMKGW